MDFEELFKYDRSLRASFKQLLIEPDGPFSILIAKFKLTNQCNLRCRMCDIWKDGLRNKKELPIGKVLESIEFLKGQGLVKLSLSGGEPLLYPGFKTLILHALKLGLQVNITTNGTLIDETWADFLLFSGVHRVNISLDSCRVKFHDMLRGIEGSFKRTVKGIKRLLKQKNKLKSRTKIAVNTLLTRKNIDNMDRMYEFLKDLGIDSWRILPVDTDDKRLMPKVDQWRNFLYRIDRYRPLLARDPVYLPGEGYIKMISKGWYAGNFYERNHCFAPWFSVFVNYDGNTYPCCMGKGQMRPYGNLLEQGLQELIHSSVAIDIRHSFASAHQFNICRACDDFLEENRVINKIIMEDA